MTREQHIDLAVQKTARRLKVSRRFLRDCLTNGVPPFFMKGLLTVWDRQQEIEMKKIA